jgi:hypothetical protein
MQSRIERVDAALRHELSVASFPVIRDGQPARVDGWSVTPQDLDGMSTEVIRSWIYWNDGTRRCLIWIWRMLACRGTRSARHCERSPAP